MLLSGGRPGSLIPRLLFLCLISFLLLEGIDTKAKTERGVAETSVNALAVGCSAFKQEYRCYPAETNWFAELTGASNAVINTRRIIFCDLVHDTPLDVWGHSFVYHYPGQHNTNSFEVYSRGEDGETLSNGNDPDDINSWDQARHWRKHYYRGANPWVMAGITLFFFVLAIACRQTVRNNKGSTIILVHHALAAWTTIFFAYGSAMGWIFPEGRLLLILMLIPLPLYPLIAFILAL